MNCKKCGNILTEGTITCPICGEPVNSVTPGIQPVAPAAQPTPAETPAAQPTPEAPTATVAPTIPVAPAETQAQPAPAAPVPEAAVSAAQPAPTTPVTPAPEVQPLAQPAAPVAPAAPIDTNTPPTLAGLAVTEGVAPTPDPVAAGAVQAPVTVPKNNNIFTIIIIILIVAILGVGAFVLVNLNKDKNNSSTKETTKETANNKDEKEDKDKEDKDDKDDKKDKDKDKDKDDDSGKEVGKDENIYQKYGYTFKIPSALKYQITSEALTISDSATFQYNFLPAMDIYDSIAENPSVFEESLQAAGAIVNNYMKKIVSGNEFVLYNVSIQGNLAICYVSEISSSVVAFGCGMATTQSGHDKALKYINEIIQSADTTSFAAPSEEENLHVEISVLEGETPVAYTEE